MSGGAFDYISCADAEQIFSNRHQLRSLIEALEREAPGSEAAKDSRYLLDRADSFVNAFDEFPLEGVWHALEWWYSGDSGREKFEKQVQAYDAAREGTSDKAYRVPADFHVVYFFREGQLHFARAFCTPQQAEEFARTLPPSTLIGRATVRAYLPEPKSPPVVSGEVRLDR